MEEALTTYGPLGIGVFFLGVLLNKVLNILLADRDKAISDRDAMIQDLLTKVFPAITKNTEILETRQQLDRELIDAIRQTNNLRIDTKKAFEDQTEEFEKQRRAFENIKYLTDRRGA